MQCPVAYLGFMHACYLATTTSWSACYFFMIAIIIKPAAQTAFHFVSKRSHIPAMT